MKYNRSTLKRLIASYCRHYRRHTKKSLAHWLQVSTHTVTNIVLGTYNGKPYGKKPHVSRIVSNSDMELIRSLFR